MDTRVNVGESCTRVQCERGLGEKVAMRWLSPALVATDYTFADLDRAANRCANLLRDLGLEQGEVFFTFLPRMPEQFFAFLGSLKQQLLTGTLFSNFGEDALLDRLGDSGAAAVMLKKGALRKVLRIRDRLPNLRTILVVDDQEADGEEGIYSFPRLFAEASEAFEAEPTAPDTPSVLHYTSGSTGKPKGVVHVHGGLEHIRATARDVLGLGSEDVYWCNADQGWVTGTSYGIIGPWSLGATQVHYGGGYDPVRWMDVLAGQEVTAWYSSPTALRMLMREQESLYTSRELPALKRIYSVGEPLNPEVIAWGRKVFGREIYDTWFQTETGGIMIANRPGLPVRSGSMGRPVEGIEPAILDDAGQPAPSGAEGNLALKCNWPSLFVTYLNRETAYRSKFRNGYYLTGDMARVDAEGYYWFLGRSDDVINTSGHLVSPFEVESAILELPEVAESGIFSAPDDLLFEKVVACIHLHPGHEYTPELELKIRLYVSNRVSTIAVPQEIIPVESIPKNKSGKIMRRVLKSRYLGEDAGDTSTMEE